MLDVCGAPADAPGTQLDRRWKLAFTNPAIQRCFLDADAIQHTNKSKNLKSHFLFKKWPVPKEGGKEAAINPAALLKYERNEVCGKRTK